MRLIAFILLLLLIPLLLVISLLLYGQSSTSVLFIQSRIGLDKKEFKIYKFKTMEQQQVTVVGKFLRKLGWDELPQLVNIIKGEMAFVGPRPLTRSDIDRLEWNLPEYTKRWSVKPGITGIAQLSNVCDAQLAMKNDLYYVANKSWVLDFKLIIKSVLVPVFGKQKQQQ